MREEYRVDSLPPFSLLLPRLRLFPLDCDYFLYSSLPTSSPNFVQPNHQNLQQASSIVSSPAVHESTPVMDELKAKHKMNSFEEHPSTAIQEQEKPNGRRKWKLTRRASFDEVARHHVH